MANDVEGKVVAVTGAASGIGRATALALAHAGARLVLGDVAAAGEETAHDARLLGVPADFVRTDVTRQADVDGLTARALARHGRLDCAVNNAGIEGALRETADYPDDVFERVVQVNLVGVWRCMRAEIRAMRDTGGGAIVNMASVAGLVGAGAFSAYVASKHGVVGLTRVAAIEYAQAGIRVNAVCPGLIDTPMVDRLCLEEPDLRAALVARKPMGRLGRADEVAAAVVWLCSDAASFVTGHALAVDGGYVAQ
jgi:NAD(P)-dependent dehydrogenase (short-subunit alcohol dehydrogenase family)